jgi:hypothetical protein
VFSTVCRAIVKELSFNTAPRSDAGAPLMAVVWRTSLTTEINTPCRKAAGAEGKTPSRLDFNNG